jgi:hypothetical protein
MENVTHTKLRLVSIVVVGVLALIGMFWYLNTYLLRSRAAGTNASIDLPSSFSGNVNEEIDVPVALNSDGADIIGADIVMSFDTSMLTVTDISLNPLIVNTFSFFPRDANGALDKAKVIANANANGKVEVGAASRPGEPNAPGYNGSGLVGSVKFRLLQPGTATITVDYTPGATNDSNLISQAGEILAKVTNATVSIATPITPIDTPTPIPTSTVPTDTPTPTAVVTSTPTGSPTIIPTNTPSSTPVPSVTTTGGVSISVKTRFHGIKSAPKTAQTLPLEVTVSGGALAAPVTKTMQVTTDANGVFSGTLAYPEVPVGSGYKFYVKGPKHLKKKICTSKPVENATGTYKCTVGSLTLTQGDNSFDFTGISLVGGDLPDAQGVQDGLIDRNDIVFIINNLSSTDPTALKRGDINYDGVISAQDYSFILEALSFRFDEE